MWPFSKPTPVTSGKEVTVRQTLSAAPTLNRANARLRRVELAIQKFEGTDVDLTDLKDEAELLRIHIRRAS